MTDKAKAGWTVIIYAIIRILQEEQAANQPKAEE